MEAGLDTGPMLHIVRTPIDRKTTGELTEELAELGASAMVEVLANFDGYAAQPQDDALATYAPKIDKAEAKIDWSEPAEVIERMVRGLAPFPGAWFEVSGANGPERVKLLLAEVADGAGAAGAVIDTDLTIACGIGALRPLRLQRAGKPAMDRQDFQHGRPVEVGTLLK
jgi:methionyl-tRNA formyltransferase